MRSSKDINISLQLLNDRLNLSVCFEGHFNVIYNLIKLTVTLYAHTSSHPSTRKVVFLEFDVLCNDKLVLNALVIVYTGYCCPLAVEERSNDASNNKFKPDPSLVFGHLPL